MFHQPLTNTHQLVVRTTLTITLILCITIAIFAQDGEATGVYSTAFSWAKDIGIIIGAIVLVATILYSVFNRKHYEGLKDTIEEKDLSLKAKTERIETLEEQIVKQRKDAADEAEKLKLKHKADVAKLQVKIDELVLDCEHSKAAARALSQVNLQAGAVLKQLRQSGAWTGHENDIFGQKKRDQERA